MTRAIFKLAAAARTPAEARAFLARVERVSKFARGGVLRGRVAPTHQIALKTRTRGFAAGLHRGSGEEGTRGVEESAVKEASEAFERGLLPVREAIVEALQFGGIEAMRGLRAMLPGLLGEVNAEPALAEVLALHVGRAVIEGRVKDDGALVNGAWRKELHPTGRNGRFVDSKLKMNIQKGLNAIRRVYSDEIDVPAAMYREDVGDIDFLWDHNGMGIRHIIARREKQDADRPDLNKLGVYELLDRLPEVIARGKIVPVGDKLEVDHEGIRVLLARRDGKSGNVWLMSGFEFDPKNQRKGKNR